MKSAIVGSALVLGSHMPCITTARRWIKNCSATRLFEECVLSRTCAPPCWYEIHHTPPRLWRPFMLSAGSVFLVDRAGNGALLARKWLQGAPPKTPVEIAVCNLLIPKAWRHPN